MSAAALVVAGALVNAQSPAPPRSLRSSVELTVVTATVLDQDNHLVTGLTRDAFEVYEDGEPQPITQFTRERVPIALGLLLDVSDSMFGERIRDARAAVERFLTGLLAPADAFFLMSFNHQPRLLTPWTSDATAVRDALANIRSSGGTAIYDSVLSALPLMDERARERRHLRRRRHHERRLAAGPAIRAPAGRHVRLRGSHRFPRTTADQHTRES